MTHKSNLLSVTATLALSALLAVLLTGCGYKVEGDKVYYITWNEGQGRVKKPLPGADAHSFQVLQHERYAKDRNYGYYQGVRIAGVEPLSFRSIHEFYAIDNRRAYYGSDEIKGSDGSSFEVMDPNWARDKNDYYYMTTPIGVCDPATFTVRSEWFNWWASDSKCIYCRGKKVPIRDRASAVLFRCGFSKDRFGVYYDNRRMQGADPETFTMWISNNVETCFGTDRNGCYLNGEKSKCPF